MALTKERAGQSVLKVRQSSMKSREQRLVHGKLTVYSKGACCARLRIAHQDNLLARVYNNASCCEGGGGGGGGQLGDDVWGRSRTQTESLHYNISILRAIHSILASRIGQLDGARGCSS